ncbi:MAG: CDGSH iron-sulfur domain-containing protein [Mariprofundaceae bacterium]|nr:CDGSH iron-sulfur domain-containing protein [Mariprofundaceae bacterium]
MSRVHRYTGEELIVEFDLGRCIHPGDCTAALPAVFDSKRTGRWVHPDAADAQDVARVCAECPTGALRCIDKASGKVMQAEARRNTIRMVADGPLYVHASMQVNGEVQVSRRAALCRCGASRLMPYCDNSHRSCDFHDAGHVEVSGAADGDPQGMLSISSITDGPLHIEGPFTLLDADGTAVSANEDAWLCRCGASSNKPFCDGSHKKIGFKAD